MQTVKRLRKTLLCAAIAVAPIGAHAASDVDFYYMPYSQLKANNSDGDTVNFESTNGYGTRGNLGVTPWLFLSGEFERNDAYDPASFNTGGVTIDQVYERTEQYRGGFGVKAPTTPFYMRAEYIALISKTHVNAAAGVIASSDDKSEGWGGHMGAKGSVLDDYVTLNAEIGYVNIGESDGLEVMGGVTLNVTQNLGVFADYRYASLTPHHGDSADELYTQLGEARVGARFSF